MKLRKTAINAAMAAVMDKARKEAAQSPEATPQVNKAAALKAAKAEKVVRLDAKEIVNLATKLAAVALQSTAERSKADATFHTALMDTADAIVVKGNRAAVEIETGYTDRIRAVMAGVEKALRVTRGTDVKGTPDAYATRIKSDAGAVFSACQVGQEIKVWRWPSQMVKVNEKESHPKADEKGNVLFRYSIERPERVPEGVTLKLGKEATDANLTQVETSAAFVLRHMTGNVRDVVMEARRIRSRFIKPNKGSGGGNTVKAYDSKRVAAELTELAPHLQPGSFLDVFRWFRGEVRIRVKAQKNHAQWDTAADECEEVLARLLSETSKEQEKQKATALGMRGTSGRRGKLQDDGDGALSGDEKAKAIKSAKTRTARRNTTRMADDKHGSK